MIYQIFYDENSSATLHPVPGLLKPFGVYKARERERVADYLYDDVLQPNLTRHNTLCEWRVLYYIWKHHPSPWVGFTSWQHDKKNFAPKLSLLQEQWIARELAESPIVGFAVRSLSRLMVKGLHHPDAVTLKSQFTQWSRVEDHIQKKVRDKRSMPMGRYHTADYWDFVIEAYRRLNGVDLEKELDWVALGQNDKLHTWCNAFAVQWDYFDAYMHLFSPIVFNLLEYIGSHPIDLELSYICERLIILFNYIRFADNKFSTSALTSRNPKEQLVSASVEQNTYDHGSKTNPSVDPTGKKPVSAAQTDFSIVTCSTDDEKFAAFSENVAAVFGQNAQLVRVADAKSLSEGYNRALAYANGQILIFCHDDIRFLSPATPSLIKQDLAYNDIVGVAGTTKLVTGQWHASGIPHTHGQVIHACEPPLKDCYQLCLYGSGSDNAVVENVQALDGLFFALKPNVLEQVRFDERLFDGFHLYDLDFTYSAYLLGLRIVVDYRIQLLHHSSGAYDDQWKRYARIFNQKYADRLSYKDPNASCAIRRTASDSIEILKTTMFSNYHSSRCN